MEIFIGSDVSVASSAVCVLDEHGRVVKRAQIDREPEALLACVRNLPGPVEAVGLDGPAVAGDSSRPGRSGLRADPDGEPGQGGPERHAREDRPPRCRGHCPDAPLGLVRACSLQIGVRTGDARPAQRPQGGPEGGTRHRAVAARRPAQFRDETRSRRQGQGALRGSGPRAGRGEFRAGDSRLGHPGCPGDAERLAVGAGSPGAQACPMERRLPADDDDAPSGRLREIACRAAGGGAGIALTVRSAMDDPTRLRPSGDVGPRTVLPPAARSGCGRRLRRPTIQEEGEDQLLAGPNRPRRSPRWDGVPGDAAHAAAAAHPSERVFQVGAREPISST